MKSTYRAVSLIMVALIAGAVLGLTFPTIANTLTPASKLILQLIKVVAAPLIFFAVLEALLRHRVEGRDFVKLIIITTINSTLAISIGLVVANFFQPGQYIKNLIKPIDNSGLLKSIDFTDLLAKQFPTSIVQPFTDNSIMPIVLLALLLGFAWRKVIHDQYAEYSRVASSGEVLISFMRNITETALIWIVKLVPLAVFSATARMVAEHGLSAFQNLGKYAALCLLGIFLHAIFTYSAWLLFFVRIHLWRFWIHALQPTLYAFGVNSSLAALPLTLKSLDALGVSRRASTLAACVGTNINNDGIILYEGFTLIAIAQASGFDLSLGSQILAAVYCIIAAMGVAGVPESGIVALTLVLGNLGLPVEVLTLLLSVDWIIARGRSFLNTNADLVGSMVLDRWIFESEAKPKHLI